MVLAYAPIEDERPHTRPPPVYKREIRPIHRPAIDNTECNYIVMAFVGGVFLMGLIDSLRSK